MPNFVWLVCVCVEEIDGSPVDLVIEEVVFETGPGALFHWDSQPLNLSWLSGRKLR